MSTVVDLESHQIIQFVDQNWSDVLVTDNIDVALVRRAFRRHRNRTDYCREQSKSGGAPVIVVLIIGKTGEIVDAQIQKAGQVEPALLSCIKEGLKGWTFPPPNGGGMAVLRLVL